MGCWSEGLARRTAFTAALFGGWPGTRVPACRPSASARPRPGRSEWTTPLRRQQYREWKEKQL